MQDVLGRQFTKEMSQDPENIRDWLVSLIGGEIGFEENRLASWAFTDH